VWRSGKKRPTMDWRTRLEFVFLSTRTTLLIPTFTAAFAAFSLTLSPQSGHPVALVDTHEPSLRSLYLVPLVSTFFSSLPHHPQPTLLLHLQIPPLTIPGTTCKHIFFHLSLMHPQPTPLHRINATLHALTVPHPQPTNPSAARHPTHLQSNQISF
jgi:hypothetical protein